MAVRAQWFKRKTDPRRIIPTKRDLQILRYAYEHRLISTSHFYTLFASETPSQQRKIRERLRLLYDHRFLDAPHLQRADHRSTGSVPKVYSLTRKGARKIEKSWGARDGKLGDEIGRRFFEHTLLITSIMVAFERGAADLGRVRLIPFDKILSSAPEDLRTSRYPGRWKAEVGKRESSSIGWTEAIGVTPDKIFGLEFLKAPRDKGRFLVFLEADRGTEPIVRKIDRIQSPQPKQLTSVYRKLLAYKASFNDRIERRFGFAKGFRTLVVTTEPGRVDSMLEAAATLSGTRRMFLFTVADQLLDENPLAHGWINGHGEAVRLIDTVF